MKQCTVCQVARNLDQFTKSDMYHGGYTAICRGCRNTQINELGKRYMSRSTEELTLATPKEKECFACKVTKKASEFHFNPRMRMPLGSRCRECHKAGMRAAGSRNKSRVTVEIPSEKKCCTCGLTLPEASFHRAKRNADGLASECADCSRFRSTKRASEKPEYARGRSREWYAIPGNRARQSKTTKIRYSLKSEELIAYAKAWKKANPQKRREYAAKRLGHIAEGMVTKAEAIAILDRANGRCTYCGTIVESLELDHVVPLSKGGAHTVKNLVAACKSCNCRKQARHVYDFIAELSA